MKVSEIMTQKPACALEETSLQEVAQMMVLNDCGCVPVVDGKESKKPLGVLTDRDIMIRTVAEGKNPLDLTAGDIMTKNIVTVLSDTSVEECCNLMEEHQIRRVAVVDETGACCGMISQADIAVNTNDRKTAELVEEISKSTVTV